jgi:hypothetical protein
MIAPNIFKPRNDWNITTLRCRKLPLTMTHRIRTSIKDVTGFDPFCKTRSRKAEFVQARQLFCYFAKQHTDLSLSVIGSFLGNQDHCTVIHAIKCVEKFQDIEVHYKRIVELIEEKILDNG